MKASARLVVGIVACVALPVVLRERVPAAVALWPVAIDMGLCAWFGATLFAGREPMIARFARAERGRLEPDLVRYTRRLTVLWTAYFALAAAVTLSLWLAGWPRMLAAFAIVGNPLAMVALFVGEWSYRRRRFAHYVHAPPRAMLGHVLSVMRGRAP